MRVCKLHTIMDMHKHKDLSTILSIKTHLYGAHHSMDDSIEGGGVKPLLQHQ